MADPEPHIRSAASAPTAPTAALECRLRSRSSCSFHPRHLIHLARHRCLRHLRHRPSRLRHRRHFRYRPSRLRHHHNLRHRPSRLRHHHRHPRPRHPRTRRLNRPDRLSLAGGSRHGTQLFAGGTLRRGTMRTTSSLAATRRRSHRPTARHQGEWAASPCPGLLVQSPHQEPELHSCRRRAL